MCPSSQHFLGDTIQPSTLKWIVAHSLSLFASLHSFSPRERISPDSNQARLDNLTDSLSHDEIRYLRTRLNAIKFNKDIFLNLPVELLLHVAKYLDFEDLVITRNVSRAWRDKFSSPDFSMGIIKMHFRSQWKQTDLGDATAKQSLVNWLPKAALKRLRKQRGQYVSMSAYHYQRGGALLPTHFKVEHQYDSGRIAYKFGESILVQSLTEGHLSQPKVYTEVNRIPIQPREWLLSNDVLIAQELGRYILIHLTDDLNHSNGVRSCSFYK
jgi:hypothetical protein